MLYTTYTMYILAWGPYARGAQVTAQRVRAFRRHCRDH